ncbi:MAG TPA: amidohydrolase family protein [Vicinamibacterales bacterium]|nr:amidohydrolase family protein [Vicinamibacterales bacterium]
MRRAFELRVPVATGSDQYYQTKWTRGIGSVKRMVGAAHEARTAPIEIIRSATIQGARLLGMDARVGQVQPGKLADVIAVEGSAARRDGTATGHVRDERRRRLSHPAMSGPGPH